VVAAKKKPRRLLYFAAAGAAKSISQETFHVIQYQASDPDIAETGNDCCNIGGIIPQSSRDTCATNSFRGLTEAQRYINHDITTWPI
jgi:hypothetical protein